jgi:hypothetical protein
MKKMEDVMSAPCGSMEERLKNIKRTNSEEFFD